MKKIAFIFILIISTSVVGQEIFTQKLSLVKEISLRKLPILNPVFIKKTDYIISLNFDSLFKGIEKKEIFYKKFNTYKKEKDTIFFNEIIDINDSINKTYLFDINANIYNQFLNKSIIIFNWRYEYFVKKVKIYEWYTENIGTRYFLIDKKNDLIIFNEYEKSFSGDIVF